MDSVRMEGPARWGSGSFFFFVWLITEQSNLLIKTSVFETHYIYYLKKKMKSQFVFSWISALFTDCGFTPYKFQLFVLIWIM